MMRIMFAVAYLACALTATKPQTPTTVPASNDDEPNIKPGARPYELDWAGRTKPARPQLVDFEDLTGWRVRNIDGANARLYRSKEQRIFGEYTAKAVYTGETPRSRFVIEPPEPIVIPCEFTAVNLWVRGNNWGWINPPQSSRCGIHVLVRDAKDETYSIAVGVNNFDYWHLLHRTIVSPDGRERNYMPVGKADATIDYPARFIGIEVTGCSDERPSKLFFDALSFYKIRYKPLTFEPLPDDLPWPTTPDTILPTIKQPVKHTVTAGSAGEAAEGNAGTTIPRYDLIVDGPDGQIRYRYTPTTGGLSDIVVEALGQRFWPCWLGGPQMELHDKQVGPGTDGATTKLLSCKLDGARVVADWEIRLGEHAARYRYVLGLKGKSLTVDATAPGGKAVRLDAGLAKGLHEPKTVYVPFLTYGNDWPRVVCSSKDGAPVFLLSLFDIYNSDASVLHGGPRLHDKGAIGYTGAAEYKRKTDGKRNALCERLFINVSGDVHEVLPNIPNPPCDTGEIAREYLWRNIGHPQRKLMARYKAYGIDKFIACHHEVGWRDAGESFTMRLRAAPRIGDKELADYSAWLASMGYRFGTYTNYVDFAPVNGFWDEDLICLNPDGTWQTAWPRCYAMKPLRAVEMEARLAPRIHDKFGTTAQYCDVHTCYTPWGRTDYDARTPGAGKFRTQFDAYARLLLNESKAHHGPVFSEGSYHWFYAGIVDGNYGQIVPHGRGWQIEPIVDFDLLKMHPLMTDFGMGMPSMYYGRHGEWTQDRSHHSRWFDQFHTSTIAFGHIGYLSCEWGFAGTLKSYYLLHALQQRYTMVPVEQIRYFDGETLVDTSTAIASDAYKRRQIYTRYENGLQVWCNLSPEHYWDVRVDERDYVLPPHGFVAHRPDDILAYSAIVDGRRHELVVCDAYLYLDSRGQVVRTPWITAKGAVAVKRGGLCRSCIIPTTECEDVTVSLGWLLSRWGGHKEVEELKTGSKFDVKAVDASNDRVEGSEVRQLGYEITFTPAKGALKYDVDGGILSLPRPWFELSAPRRELVVGSSMPVTLSWPKASFAMTPARGSKLVVSCESPHTKQAWRWEHEVTDIRKNEVSFDLHVPADHAPFERCWYRLQDVRKDGRVSTERWFDVTAVPAFGLTVKPVERPYQPGEPVELRAELMSYLPEQGEATVALEAPEVWRVEPSERTLTVKPHVATKLAWRVELPNEPFVQPVTLRATSGEHVSSVTRWLLTRPTEWVAADLMKLAMTTGECLRGGSERPYDAAATGTLVHASSELVDRDRRDAVFMHPPYRTGVGYAFAEFKVDLPTGKPRFEFDLGFRDGSSSVDGCVFKVVVIQGETEHEVFAEHYKTLGKWASRKVDLSRFAGQPVRIKLITDVGPNDSPSSDWACWGRPRVTLGDDVYAIEVHDTEPTPAFLPPPDKLDGLTREVLKEIRRAVITLDASGVDGGKHESHLYLNGVKIGRTPPAPDKQWRSGEVPVSAEAITTIGLRNKLVIRNPGNDFMKVRNLCLRVELSDGRKASTWVDVGPYTSAKGWPYAEGQAVSLGEDLPTMRLWFTFGE